MTKHIISAAFIGLIALSPMSASAQAAGPDLAGLRAACARSATECQVATRAILVAIQQLPPAARNNAVAQAVAVVLTVARESGNAAAFGTIVQTIASVSTDGNQIANIERIVTQINTTGQVPTEAEIATAVAASA